MTRQEIKEIAREAFISHPNQDSFFITSDGMVYGSKIGASGHASTLHNSVIFIFRKDAIDNPTIVGTDRDAEIDQIDNLEPSGDVNTNLTYEDRLEKVKSAETLQELEQLLSDEKATTVKDAGDIRRRQLIVMAAESVQDLEALAEGEDDEQVLATILERKSQLESNN